MAKRGPTSELNHDNWDCDEPPEIAGTFQKASNDVIQRRVLKVAKRRSTGLSDLGESKNVFSAFQGFKSDSSSSSSNQKPSTDLSATFSFLKNNSSSPASNGIPNPSQPSMNVAVSSSTNNTFNSGIISANKNSKMNTSRDDGIGSKYPAKLIRLNQCVAEWIKSHVDKDPSCILTPIFKDYERYLKEIEEEKNRNSSDKIGSKDGSSGGSNLISSSNLSACGSFKFNQPADKTGTIAGNIIKSSSSLSPASSSSSTSPTHSIFSSFKTDNTDKSSRITSLLSKPDPASLMINPFTTSLKNTQGENFKAVDEGKKSEIPGSIFKSSQESTTTSSLLFGGGQITPFGSTGSAGLSSSKTPCKESNNDNDGDAEESDEPPKPDFAPIQEKDAVYNKRCKVFIKKDTNYADLGIGTLFIKPVAGEKNQLIVRADTSLGNILVNVLLTSAIPTQRMGKNNVMIICVPTPPPAGSTKQPTPSTVLLRVKTAEEADDLLKALEKFKK